MFQSFDTLCCINSNVYHSFLIWSDHVDEKLFGECKILMWFSKWKYFKEKKKPSKTTVAGKPLNKGQSWIPKNILFYLNLNSTYFLLLWSLFSFRVDTLLKSTLQIALLIWRGHFKLSLSPSLSFSNTSLNFFQ